MMLFGFIFLGLFILAILSALMIISDLKTHGRLFDDTEKFVGVCICLFEFFVAASCILSAYKIFVGMLS